MRVQSGIMIPSPNDMNVYPSNTAFSEYPSRFRKYKVSKMAPERSSIFNNHRMSADNQMVAGLDMIVNDRKDMKNSIATISTLRYGPVVQPRFQTQVLQRFAHQIYQPTF